MGLAGPTTFIKIAQQFHYDASDCPEDCRIFLFSKLDITQRCPPLLILLCSGQLGRLLLFHLQVLLSVMLYNVVNVGEVTGLDVSLSVRCKGPVCRGSYC